MMFLLFMILHQIGRATSVPKRPAELDVILDHVFNASEGPDLEKPHMNCIIRLSCLLLSASLASPSSGTDTITFDQITPERIGEFVTVTGKVSGFFPPPEPRAPYAFSLADKANKEMRVVAWPDIYERVDRRDLLQTTGTLVTLTAEVAEYKEKLELHLQDWEEIEVGTSETATLATVAGDRKTTE